MCHLFVISGGGGHSRIDRNIGVSAVGILVSLYDLLHNVFMFLHTAASLIWPHPGGPIHQAYFHCNP